MEKKIRAGDDDTHLSNICPPCFHPVQCIVCMPTCCNWTKKFRSADVTFSIHILYFEKLQKKNEIILLFKYNSRNNCVLRNCCVLNFMYILVDMALLLGFQHFLSPSKQNIVDGSKIVVIFQLIYSSICEWFFFFGRKPLMPWKNE